MSARHSAMATATAATPGWNFPLAAAMRVPRLPRRVSLLHYAPLLVVLLIALADSGQFTDPDLWGHVRFGQITLANHGPVLTDPYSYSAFGQPWRNHEWLTEAVMALCYDHLGVVGLKLWKFACTAATILFLALGLAETGATAGAQLGSLTLAAVALMPQMQFRPQLFTFLLFAGLLALLARHRYRGYAPLWIAIPMMALWGNLHGGYIIGIATLAAYAAVVAAQDLAAGRGFGRGLRLGTLAIAATLATLMSPYGIDNWLVVLNALHLHMVRSVIGDWTPLVSAIVVGWRESHSGVMLFVPVLAMIVMFGVAVTLQPAAGDFPFVAIASAMSLAAFAAARNMPLAVIACTLPVARHGALLFARLRGRAQVSRARSAPPERSGVNPIIAGATAAAVALYFGLFSARLKTDADYPSSAIAFMQAHRLRGNVLVDFNWGQYFIWRAPESKVFIDGRNDSVYPLKILDQYVAFYFGHHGAADLLADYPHEFVLIPPSSKAHDVMTKARGWKLIYRDPSASLFTRADSAAARVTGAPIVGKASPAQYFP